jgi:hypothetical protein
MSSHKPWSPAIDADPVLHPFAPPDGRTSRGTLTLADPEEDTAPLQGTRDISDADSLEDVKADAESKVHRQGP